MSDHFGARLHAAMQERGRFCVGVDPHASLLRDWGLSDDVAGADAAMGEAARDGGVDRLVIAELEMEERHLLRRAPVAAVERVRADEVERAGDRLAVPRC